MNVWDDESTVRLEALWKDGKSASYIAAALGNGLTRNAIIGKVHRLGLSRPIRRVVPKVKQDHPWTERRRRKPSMPVVTLAPTQDAVVAPLPIDIGIPITEPTGSGVSINALDRLFEMCRWIVKDDPERRGGDRYCGEPTVKGCSWCAWHKAKAFTRAAPVAAEPEKMKVQKHSMGDRSFGAVAW